MKKQNKEILGVVGGITAISTAVGIGYSLSHKKVELSGSAADANLKHNLDQITKDAKIQKKDLSLGGQLTEGAIIDITNRNWPALLDKLIAIRMKLYDAEIKNQNMAISASKGRVSASKVVLDKAKKEQKRFQKNFDDSYHERFWSLKYKKALDKAKERTASAKKKVKATERTESKVQKAHVTEIRKLEKMKVEFPNGPLVKKAKACFINELRAGVTVSKASQNLLASAQGSSVTL